MRIPACVLLLFLAFNTALKGQTADDPGSGDLSLNIRSVAFFKNNEYSVPSSVFDRTAWLEGYTLTGFFFQPELVYSPSARVSILAGAHFLKYSGMDVFSTIRPVFSTSVKLTENTILTLGTLSGSDDHRLFDPHFNKETLYNAFVEDGFQLKTETDRIFNDFWISWENFIFRGDNEREVFTSGESFRYTSPDLADFMTISLPLQVQFRHFGGQISNYPEPVETFFNLAAGVRLGFFPADKKFGTFSVEYVQYLSKTLPGRESDAVTDGNASWTGLSWDYGPLNFTSSYWNANDFYAPLGNGIYSSVYDFSSGVVLPKREVFTNSLSLNLFPESFIRLYFGIDTYYDMRERKMDHAATLHLDFGKLIRIATIR